MLNFGLYLHLFLVYMSQLRFISMNRIRKHWKNNGTPFFFCFNDGHQKTFLDAFTCTRYDSIIVDEDKNLTAMDTLVDIRNVLRSLEMVDDSLVKSSVFDALSSVLDNLKYIVQLNSNK